MLKKMWLFGLFFLGALSSSPASISQDAENIPAAFNSAEQVLAGEYHTCALTRQHTVQCWGFNYFGSLGNGSQNTSSAPVAVMGLDNVTSIASGAGHTCALTFFGGVKCWGYNGRGQLGIGIVNSHDYFRLAPMNVIGLDSGATAIVAGPNHTCAAMAGGGVKCWGYNQTGQLGDGGALTEQLAPVNVLGLSDEISALAAGRDHTCALTASGGVKCWGSNDQGQLGSRNDQFIPRDVVGLGSGVQAIAAGEYSTCALMTTGGLKCWGEISDGNESGKCSYGSPYPQCLYEYEPVDIVGLQSGVNAISMGRFVSCATMTDYKAQCWGWFIQPEISPTLASINTRVVIPLDGLYGEIKNFAFSVYSGLEAAQFGASWTDDGHICALMQTGGVKCWGNNSVGQLGNGVMGNKNLPSLVPGLANSVSVKAGETGRPCAVLRDESVWCWSGRSGPVPARVEGLEAGVISLANNDSMACAVMRGGRVRCWEKGQPSFDFSNLTESASAIVGGGDHFCALMALNGSVKCWGLNNYGQLGDGTTESKYYSPVDVVGLTNVVSLSAGGGHTCAILTDGGMKCWGYNANGELGNPMRGNSSVPLDVRIAPGPFKTVSTGWGKTCAVTQADKGMCWGEFALSDAPELQSNVADISADSFHLCLLTVLGSVKCLGQNAFGELGDGTFQDRLYAFGDVRGLTEPAVSLSAANHLTCAVLQSGKTYCWGDNSQAQIGDNTAWQSAPVCVTDFVCGNYYLPALSQP